MDFNVNKIVGNMYGNLEVLYYHHTESTNNGGIHYMCYCHKCGVKVIYTYKELKYGRIEDCGCSIETFVPKSILHKKFGRLKPVEIKYKKDGIVYYICDCDCGNRLTLTNIDLINNHREFCGCGAKEIFNFDSDIDKPNYTLSVSSYSLGRYHKKLYKNMQKAAELESKLTVNEDGEIIGKDGSRYPIRWNKNNKNGENINGKNKND